ncbi:hypothetical protein BDU57DRAFT_571196 [Ampelomyces quisqualis]|uniref:Uncharacterized protein n=1 Tax=Ampelomyces quisqualis TaxID=50730 RepID=A0A6A5QQG3_AMPQU|nr:hypothetical protein BDU57DRAFT_571196 [Ampelomyces quisqualis]
MLLDQCLAERFYDLKAFEAAVGKKPIFTRPALNNAAANIEQVRDVITQFDPIFVPLAVGGDGRVMLDLLEAENEHMGCNGLYNLYGVLLKADLTAMYTFKPDDHESNVIRQEIVRIPPPPAELEQISELDAQLPVSPVWAETKKLLVTFPTRIDNIVCLGRLPGQKRRTTCLCMRSRRVSRRLFEQEERIKHDYNRYLRHLVHGSSPATPRLSMASHHRYLDTIQVSQHNPAFAGDEPWSPTYPASF